MTEFDIVNHQITLTNILTLMEEKEYAGAKRLLKKEMKNVDEGVLAKKREEKTRLIELETENEAMKIELEKNDAGKN